MVRIIHISDLHFGPNEAEAKCFAPDPLPSFIEKIREQNPDIIVASGDFIQACSSKENVVKSFERAREFLRKMAATIPCPLPTPCSPPCPLCQPLLVVPGNHDVVRDDADPLARFRDHIGNWFCAPEEFIAKEYEKNHGAATDHYFRKGSCYVYPNLGVLFYLFSSVKHYSRSVSKKGPIETKLSKYVSRLSKTTVDKNDKRLLSVVSKELRNDRTGIGADELNKFRETLAEVGGELGSHRLSTIAKIAIVHHNLAHTIDADEDEGGFIDAGPFKQVLCDHFFDLVLDGHKHVSHGCFELSSAIARNWGLHTLVAPKCALDQGVEDVKFLSIEVNARSYEVYERVAISRERKESPDPFWSFTAGRSGRRKIPVVSWRGYNVPAAVEVASSNGIRFIEHSGLKGNFNNVRLESDDAVIVIDDHQSNDVNITDGSRKTLTESLKEKPAKCLLEPEDHAWMLPLRCGLNAVAIDGAEEKAFKHAIGRSFSVRNLISDAKRGVVGRGDTMLLAAWDRAEICIPFLYCAAYDDQKLSDAYDATPEQLAVMVSRLKGCRRKPIVLCKTVKKLKYHLFEQRSVVLGAGGWLGNGAVTKIPAEGALLWVEAAAIMGEPSPKDKERIRTFLGALLMPDAQRAIANADVMGLKDKSGNAEAYTGCPVVNNVQGLWDSKDHDVQEIFRDAEFKHLHKGVCRQRYPKHPGAWGKCWEDLLAAGVLRRDD